MFGEVAQKRINSIQFGLFSPDEVRNGSVVHVLHPETMEGGLPKENGLNDLRMGTTEKGFLCQTCNSNMYECNGHFGHIELTRPMFHVGYLNRVKKTLDCVCFYCSKLKTAKGGLPAGLNGAWEVLKGRNVCEGEPSGEGSTGCFNRQPIIRREGLNLVAFMKGEDSEGKVILSGEKVYGILKRIPQEDYEFLGYSKEHCRPEWMLLTTVLVPPPCVRPSVVTGGFLRSEDDLTHKLADIVKANACLRRYEQEGAAGHIVRDYEQLLQFHLATFVDNNLSGQPQSLQKNGRPLKCISARLRGKEGRVRGNLMGKRVDFSARSVITPDPNISVEEVGVPQDVARVLTFPERVTALNIAELQKLVRRGPGEHPGANYVVRTDGQRIDLRFSREELRLEPGFIVERHMQEGDPILFNRQPSLHKMSMMGHRAKIMPGRSFRLNLSVTAPYNADFDGDEMNLHMPQSYATRAELVMLAGVPHQIVSPQSNRPVIGIVQDACVGSRLLTMRSTFLGRRDAMGLLACVAGRLPKRGDDVTNYCEPAILRPVRLWTGKQLFSSILPEMVFDSEDDSKPAGESNSSKYLRDARVLVRGGALLCGALDRKFVGAQHAGAVHTIYTDFGSDAARLFIDNVQRVVNHYIQYVSSFTVGIGDCVADADTLQLCRGSIQRAMREVDSVIEEAKRSGLEKLPGLSLSETFESRVNVILNRARDVSGTSAQNSLETNNNMKMMVLAGSKGSYINISQVTTCVGQQNVEGRRIPFGFVHRTLPHFTKFDYSARSRGFVENSYLSGLRPWEFFFHAMGGREGLIDTAIKTAETGYIQRRLVKALEDLSVQHDGSVRSGTGALFQYVYGDDTFDATHLESVRLPVNNFKLRYYIDLSAMQAEPELQKRVEAEFNQLYAKRTLLPDLFPSPVNIQRLILRHTVARGSGKSQPGFIPLAELSRCLDSVQALATTGNSVLDYYIRLSLSPRLLLTKLPLRTFDRVVAEIGTRLLRARINAGEMVGTLAAQSVGEPATQMTLNTFHLAGVSSNLTMGVPRFNEIINVARSIRTPTMRIVLASEYAASASSARSVQSQLEFTTLRSLCRTAALIYDPEPETTCIPADVDMVASYFEMPDEDVDFASFGRLLLRIELDRSSLLSKSLSLEQLSGRIRQLYGTQVHIISTDENAPCPILRIRFRDGSLEFYSAALSTILRTHLLGCSGINRAYILSDSSGSWALQTDGVNLRPVMAHEQVDGPRVTSNDLVAISEVLGIEAARQAILDELSLVIEANGSHVNHRHMALLADVMCVRGYLTGITRHGVNKEGVSAMKKASFEQTVDVLLEAAVSSKLDEAAGITENIMMGQLAPLGTGAVSLLLDMTKLGRMASTIQDPVLCNSPTSDVNSAMWSPQFTYGSPGFDEDERSVVFSPLYSEEGGYVPGSPSYSPISVAYSPASSSYSPASPSYSPTSPSYSPASPSYSPTSPSYSPVSPSYSPASPSYSPISPSYSPISPSYSPISPSYSPVSTKFSKKTDENSKK